MRAKRALRWALRGLVAPPLGKPLLRSPGQPMPNEGVRKLTVELTTTCNASCPQCPRNHFGGRENENVPSAELSLEQIRTALTSTVLANLEAIYFAGNYGDPAASHELLSIAEYCRTANRSIEISLSTNGSLRPPSFWRALASKVDSCRFALDGLSDTNHIYRRGTSWPRIMENARAYIDAGGVADWVFIVFEHNMHQLEDAEKLARVMGFRDFLVKRTHRFFDAELGTTRPLHVLTRTGHRDYVIGPPTQKGLYNPAVRPSAKVYDYLARLETAEITCRAEESKSAFLSAEGFLFPCAYTAHIYYRGPNGLQNEVTRLLAQAPEGKNSLNAIRHSVQSIVSGVFWDQLLPEHWKPGRLGEGRLSVCARVCGGRPNMFCECNAGPLPVSLLGR